MPQRATLAQRVSTLVCAQDEFIYQTHPKSITGNRARASARQQATSHLTLGRKERKKPSLHPPSLCSLRSLRPILILLSTTFAPFTILVLKNPES
jgi:hypothetical protein